VNFMPPREVLIEGEQIGRERARDAARHGGRPKFDYEGEEKDSAQSHIAGAQAEAAFAWRFGLVWTRSNIWRGGGGLFVPDVLPFWEVRHSKDPRTVKVKPDDPRHRIVVGLTGGGTKPYEITGAIIAGWAQTHLATGDPGHRGAPVHWVGRNHLMPIEEGFHANHGWNNTHGVEPAVRTREWPDGIPAGAWLCVYCGVGYVGPTPDERGLRRDDH
jgi:hypothetical protein